MEVQSKEACSLLQPQLVLYHSISSEEQLKLLSRRQGRTIQIPPEPQCKLPALLDSTDIDLEHLADQLRTFVLGVAGTAQTSDGCITQISIDDPQQQQQAVLALLHQTLLQTAAGDSRGSADSTWYRKAAGTAATDVLASSSYSRRLLHMLPLLALLLREPVQVLLPHHHDLTGPAAAACCSSSHATAPRPKRQPSLQDLQLLIMPPQSSTGAGSEQPQDEPCAGGGVTAPEGCSPAMRTACSSQATCSSAGGLMGSAHCQLDQQVPEGLLPVKQELEQQVQVQVQVQVQAPVQQAASVLSQQQLLQPQLQPVDTFDMEQQQQQQQQQMVCDTQASPSAKLLQLKLSTQGDMWRLHVISHTPCILQQQWKRRQHAAGSVVMHSAPDTCCTCSRQLQEPASVSPEPLFQCSGAFCAYVLCWHCAKAHYQQMSYAERVAGCAPWGWLCRACVLRGRRIDNEVYLKPLHGAATSMNAPLGVQKRRRQARVRGRQQRASQRQHQVKARKTL